TTLNLGDPAAIGSGALVLNSGTLQTSLAAGLTLANALTLANSNVSLGGNGNPMTFTGTPTLSGTTVTLSTPLAADSVTFTGNFAGAVNLTKTGLGSVAFAATTGSNAFAQLTVNA